jgi:ring-1,2-phenylacetyl-CoA epoxidase subunit PaaC
MDIKDAHQAREHPTYHQALVRWITQLADDELTLGHRDSEWLGLCPDIEGDVAFSSIAQDEVGHAAFYFELLHELGEPDPDRLAFARKSHERRNAKLVEQENGDWAYSILRHTLYDIFDGIRLEAMRQSSYLPLRHGVAKIQREEAYHLLHMKTWVVRMGKAGGEARQYLEEAAVRVWPQLDDLFSFGDADEETLLRFGIIGFGSAECQKRWEEQVKAIFGQAGLPWPGEIPMSGRDGRLGQHDPALAQLLKTMTEVYRLDPVARW